jgi:predicted nucleic acid-binding Zn ribbon protein
MELETVKLTPEQEKARKRRNMMIALAILAFVVLVFFISIAQIRAGIIAGAGQ